MPAATNDTTFRRAPDNRRPIPEPIERGGAQAANLAELQMPCSAACRHTQEEVRAQGQEIFAKMRGFLPGEIDQVSFPDVVLQQEAETSSFDKAANRIIIAGRDVGDGYVFGEEISHWIRDRLSPAGTREMSDTPLSRALGEEAVRAVDEFFGFIGRAVAEAACRGTPLEKLFKPESLSFPGSHQTMAKSAALHRELGHRAANELADYSDRLGAVLEALRGLSQEAFLGDPTPENAAKFSVAVRAAQDRFGVGADSSGKDIEQGMSAVLQMLSSVSSNAAQERSRLPFRREAADFCRRALSSFALRAESLAVELGIKELEALAEALDVKGHGAGYTSAALAIERGASAEKLFRDLIAADDRVVYIRHMACDSYGDEKGAWRRLMERAKVFLTRD